MKSKKKIILPEIKKCQVNFKNNESQYQKVKEYYDKLLKNQEELKNIADLTYLRIREEDGSLERFKNTLSDLEQNKELQDDKIKHYNQKLENYIANSNFARANVENQKKKNGILTNEVANLKVLHSKLEEDILSKKEDKNILQSKIANITSQIEFYTNIIENLEGRPTGVKRILRNKEKYPKGCFVMFQLEIMQIKDNNAVKSTIGMLNPSIPRKY